ncbi:hypothetical protein C8F04DRAFT_1255793 [Mycena alexandri]|uniref:F-box domain-containing protein n=1 Tax=Mycena alexandri TaxID=1745969 RepID=A0AAD6X4B2_9AGAR|nr:hypothetical protein C8F04DRAFT_1255793 [Mycena alexandri]
MSPLPVEHWPLRLHTRIDTEMPLSFSPDEDVAVYICGAGLSLVSLRFEAAAGNKDIKPKFFEIADVDSLRGCIDRTTSSWTFRLHKGSVLVTLSFANISALDAFLNTLSYVRVLHGHSSVTSHYSHHIPIPSTEKYFAVHDVKGFADLRAAVYLRAPIHVLPIEILSQIFVFLPPAQSQHDRSSPLFLLRVCATWRAVALATAALWRRPSFVINNSFFRADSSNSCRQMLMWMARAKSEIHRQKEKLT